MILSVKSKELSLLGLSFQYSKPKVSACANTLKDISLATTLKSAEQPKARYNRFLLAAKVLTDDTVRHLDIL